MAKKSILKKIGFNEIQTNHLGYDLAPSLSATGNNSQADAIQLKAEINQFTTVGATTNSSKLPDLRTWATGYCLVRNDGANNLNQFPFLGQSINALAANAAVVIPPGEARIFEQIANLQWVMR